MRVQVSFCDKAFAAPGHIAEKRSFPGLKRKLSCVTDTYVDTEVGFQIASFLEGALAANEGTD